MAENYVATQKLSVKASDTSAVALAVYENYCEYSENYCKYENYVGTDSFPSEPYLQWFFCPRPQQYLCNHMSSDFPQF